MRFLAESRLRAAKHAGVLSKGPFEVLKVLFAADPSGVHQRRYLELLIAERVQVYLLDDHPTFKEIDVPLAAHWRWPRSGRRTVSRMVGSALANCFADGVIDLQLKLAWRRSQAKICHVVWLDERALMCARAGLHPLVVTAIGRIAELNESDPYLLEKIKQSLAGVDLFIAPSKDMIVLAQQLVGRELNSLVLPIGIDTNLFRPGYAAEATAWRAELGIPQEARVILSPRVIRPNYRQAEIMRAFAAAIYNYGLDAFILFNRFHCDLAYVEEILAIARAQSVLERVRVIDEPPYGQLPILYALSDLAINFPILDTFPVTFLECAACERPILTNRKPDYSSNGIADFLNFMEGEDIASIGRQIALLCRNESVRPKARAARIHVVRNFNEKAFVDKLLGAYNTLLAPSARY